MASIEEVYAPVKHNPVGCPICDVIVVGEFE